MGATTPRRLGRESETPVRTAAAASRPHPPALRAAAAAPTCPGSAPSEALEDIIVRLQEIVDDNPGECADKVEDALAKAQTALDELNKTPPGNQAALGNIEGSVGDLEEIQPSLCTFSAEDSTVRVSEWTPK